MSLSASTPDDFAAPTSKGRPTWHKYVRTLCTEAWDFDDGQTHAVLQELEQLVRAERVKDGAVVDVLLAAGVSETSAMMIAPSIRVSILS